MDGQSREYPLSDFGGPTEQVIALLLNRLEEIKLELLKLGCCPICHKRFTRLEHHFVMVDNGTYPAACMESMRN